MNAAPSVWILVIRAASGVVPLRAAARLMAPTVPVTIWFISVTAHGAQAVMNRQPARTTETNDSFDIRMELRMERMGLMTGYSPLAGLAGHSLDFWSDMNFESSLLAHWLPHKGIASSNAFNRLSSHPAISMLLRQTRAIHHWLTSPLVLS